MARDAGAGDELCWGAAVPVDVVGAGEASALAVTVFAPPTAVGAGLAALVVGEAPDAFVSPPCFSAAPPHAARPTAAARVIRHASLFLFMAFFESP